LARRRTHSEQQLHERAPLFQVEILVAVVVPVLQIRRKEFFQSARWVGLSLFNTGDSVAAPE